MPKQTKKKTPFRFVPYLTVSNVKQSIAFYEKVFGLKVTNTSINDHGVIIHVEMRKDQLSLMFAPEGACGEPDKTPKHFKTDCSMAIYAYLPSVDLIYKRALRLGAKSRSEPRIRFWGERMAEFEDLDGYQWYVTWPVEKT